MSIVLTEEEMGIFIALFRGPKGPEARQILETKFCNCLGFDTDPYQHAFNAGQRGLALMLCASAKADDDVVGTDYIDADDLDNTTS